MKIYENLNESKCGYFSSYSIFGGIKFFLLLKFWTFSMIVYLGALSCE